MILENKKYKNIYYSRFIASWLNATKCPNGPGYLFNEWIKNIKIGGEPIPENIVEELIEFSELFYGKVELENDAREFLINKHVRFMMFE